MDGQPTKNTKVKNARKTDLWGNPIPNLKEWKLLNPESLYFDSELERFCHVTLLESGLRFVSKPEKILIVPASVALDWGYSEDQLKNLRDFQRGVTDKKERTANTKSFNLANSKSLVYVKEAAWTWSPDYFLPEHRMYVDTKGNKTDAHWRNKLKAARHILELTRNCSVIQLQTKKEITEFVNHIKNEQ